MKVRSNNILVVHRLTIDGIIVGEVKIQQRSQAHHFHLDFDRNLEIWLAVVRVVYYPIKHKLIIVGSSGRELLIVLFEFLV